MHTHTHISARYADPQKRKVSHVIACEQKLNQNLSFCSKEWQEFPLAMQYKEQAEFFRPDSCFGSETGVNGPVSWIRIQGPPQNSRVKDCQ